MFNHKGEEEAIAEAFQRLMGEWPITELPSAVLASWSLYSSTDIKQ